MKRSFVFVLALLCAASAFAADPPALADRAALVAELERTSAKFLASIDGLTEAQWNFKPAPDRWSIAECAEHIAAAEPMVRKMIADSMKGELPAEQLAGAHQDDKMKMVVDRSKKFKAPEPLIPTNRFGSPADAVAAFQKERAETIALAKSDVDLRTHGSNHFLLGPLDSYGWFLFTSGHSERHTLQIEEVKTVDGYPN
jgi:hypothetical protein